MTEGADIKVCPMCAETMKAAARVCPFCQSRQSRFAIWGYELAGALAGIFLLGLTITVFVWLAPVENGVGGRSLARHREDLVVLGATLGCAKAKPEFWLTGVVTNRGEHPWRVHALEIRFLDRQGSLLDVRHSDLKELFVVLPRQEHAFRVELGGLNFTNSDVAQQVRVQMATDGDRRWKPD